MDQVAVRRLVLQDFRCYGRLDLAIDPRPLALYGPNGAGKTNLLEALSLLSPGRGLRHARAVDLGRREPGEIQGRAWSVFAELEDGISRFSLATGLEAGSARRRVKIDGEPEPPARLGERLRLVWLTPQQDRLFLEGASERRRFLDRLTLAARPDHAQASAAFDHALRERLRLLAGAPDPAWLDALETEAAEAGVAVAAARRETVRRLSQEVGRRRRSAFPAAEIALSDDWADRPAEDLKGSLRRGRDRDREAGRTLSGPQRTDLLVRHAELGRPAAECSTGEQKALLLSLVLAQAAALAGSPPSAAAREAEGAPAAGAAAAQGGREEVAGKAGRTRPSDASRRPRLAESSGKPILLLDEVAAHLDEVRRAALFDEILELGLQAFLTGTDRMLFEGFGGRAQLARVDRAAVMI